MVWIPPVNDHFLCSESSPSWPPHAELTTERIAAPPRKLVRAEAPLEVESGAGSASSPRLVKAPPAHCSAMTAVDKLVDRLGPTNVTVAVLGETGSGKDVIARSLHAKSPRVDRPFVVFDCGAVAPNLIESELFGHERGAFTGAVAVHMGALERAHGGTLFLDEIGELPLELQPRLLRVLESGQVRRVGGSTVRTVDVRVIAATNRDLRGEVAAGRFREDLYFRLAGAFIHLPPLRERLDDLERLVPKLLEDLGAESTRLTEKAYDVLRAHDWPGNVRELKNTLNCALAFADGGVIEPAHFQLMSDAQEERDPLGRLPLGGQPLHLIEQTAIRQTLALTRGNKAQAAILLGIAVSTLYEKIKKLGISGQSTLPPKSSRSGHTLPPEPEWPKAAALPSWGLAVPVR
jgi:two-component system, NtrC family, response regulator HydG